MKDVELMKRRAAEEAVKLVKNGMIVGLGTGSTAAHAIRLLAKRNLDIICVATSKSSEELAKSLGLKVVDVNDVDYVDITIDGADEVDPQGNLIKGYGGALTREKIVAKMSKEEIIIVDETKLVTFLGQRGKLPIEVIPFGWKHTARELSKYGKASLRILGSEPYITDNGNYIIDLNVGRIEDPVEMESKLNSIPGVVENGLFIGLATVIIVAHSDLRVDIKRVKRSLDAVF
ncbi:MAG TPA: ribose-5-phosphate isomerase RpiA [Thermoprotei archaeon]|nr:ribose-5-phosphate isomerase RpiA [Thermoprotei archaeon]